MNSQTISDIIRGMQYAVNTAKDILFSHQIEKLSRHFNEDGNAKMRFVILPDGRKVEIPVACLTPSTSLSIEDIELEFSVKVAGSTKKGDGKDESTSYNVLLLPQKEDRYSKEAKEKME